MGIRHEIDKSQKVSFIIPVKNRDKKRIKKCVKSLKSNITGEIIIIDYGSDKPVRGIPGAKIIRYGGNSIWNKAHAINLGIKASENEYVGTVDCDMIISKEFLITAERYLNDNALIYSLNVRRIEVKNILDDFKKMGRKSNPWFKEETRKNLIHTANGGIQIYPKKWISEIGGVDESLIFWGGIDNDILERAVVSGLSVVNLNKLILHQEHKNKKEQNLPENERGLAFRIRVEKIKYLDEMFKKKKYIRNKKRWGGVKPNQKRFLKLREDEEKRKDKINQRKEKYQKAFVRAVRKGKNSFIFGWKRIKISSVIGSVGLIGMTVRVVAL